MSDDSDFSGLNAYMGHYGDQDAAQFLSMERTSDFRIPIPSRELTRARQIASDIKALRKEYGLGFDQAMQIYLLSSDFVRQGWPPITERRDK